MPACSTHLLLEQEGLEILPCDAQCAAALAGLGCKGLTRMTSLPAAGTSALVAWASSEGGPHLQGGFLSLPSYCNHFSKRCPHPGKDLLFEPRQVSG